MGEQGRRKGRDSRELVVEVVVSFSRCENGEEVVSSSGDLKVRRGNVRDLSFESNKRGNGRGDVERINSPHRYTAEDQSNERES